MTDLALGALLVANLLATLRVLARLRRVDRQLRRRPPRPDDHREHVHVSWVLPHVTGTTGTTVRPDPGRSTKQTLRNMRRPSSVRILP